MSKIKDLNRYFDHTILKPSATWKDVEKICKEAGENHFFSVCVNPVWIQDTLSYFHENDITDVDICTVIGFPLGANSTPVKIYEIEQAILDGVDELDVVINIGRLKDEEYDYISDELYQCKLLAGDRIVKVIIETALLTDDEKETATKLIMDTGCDFVKTSTGFASSGATVKDIKLLKSVTGDEIMIKASGGIRTFEMTEKLIKAGANRIGASKSVDIINEANK